MRVRKQRRHRRIVRFYTACFGFRPPYKVLCDGTFIYHLVQNRITPADQALANALSEAVKLFTTKCVIEELKRLGESHTEALEAAHKLPMARCDHEKKKSADACITEIIGEKNSEHFFVASQDVDLRKKLQEVPGVPLVYALRNSLFLEQPSTSQRQFVKAKEESRSHLSELEYKMLKMKAKSILQPDEMKDSSDGSEDLGDLKLDQIEGNKKWSGKKSTLGVKDRPQFKRKRAKGPNPLSCKKKKSRENQNTTSQKENADGIETLRSRPKKRKRSRKRKGIVETES